MISTIEKLEYLLKIFKNAKKFGTLIEVWSTDIETLEAAIAELKK